MHFSYRGHKCDAKYTSPFKVFDNFNSEILNIIYFGKKHEFNLKVSRSPLTLRQRESCCPTCSLLRSSKMLFPNQGVLCKASTPLLAPPNDDDVVVVVVVVLV